MVMQALREGASGGVLKFFLMGLMVMAVGGLVLMDVGGFFRGGVSSTDVAKVGGESISINSFDRTARRTLQRIGMDTREAYRQGYLEQILGSEIRTLILERAASENGIVVGRDLVADQIAAMVAPMVTGDQTPQSVLNQILTSQGMNENEFIEAIRREMAGSFLSAALQAGSATSSPLMAADLYAFENETRNISLVTFKENEMKKVSPPDDEQLASLYAIMRETFATDETRAFSIAVIKESELRKTLNVTEERIRAVYDSQIESYAFDESRIIEQALLDQEEDAKKVADLAGESKDLKAAVKKVTGRETAWLGQKDTAQDSLPAELSAAVMAAAQSGTIIGPQKTPLGWSVALVKKITPAGTKPYEDVKNDILQDLMENQLADDLYAVAASVDDALAAGEPFSNVVKENNLELIELPPVNMNGLGSDGKDALKAFEQTRNSILEAGFALSQEGETSAMMELGDGRFVAIHLRELTPKSYKELEDVKEQLAKKWVEDQTRLENRMKVQDILQTAAEGGQGIEQIALTAGKSIQKMNGLKRGEEKAPLDIRASMNIFEAPLNTPILVEIENGLAIVSVTDASIPENAKPNSEAVKQIQMQASKQAADETLLLLLDQKRNMYGAHVNKPLLDRAYGAEAQAY